MICCLGSSGFFLILPKHLRGFCLTIVGFGSLSGGCKTLFFVKLLSGDPLWKRCHCTKSGPELRCGHELCVCYMSIHVFQDSNKVCRGTCTSEINIQGVTANFAWRFISHTMRLYECLQCNMTAIAEMTWLHSEIAGCFLGILL